jgi:hypothetical protein
VGEPRIRLLRPSEAGRLVDAIRAVYGGSYPGPWAYDRHEIANRMAHGVLLSAIAEIDDELVCHAALSFRHPKDRVGHAGQAVTLPAARGHHLFTATKRFLADVAASRGVVGLYSEATAAHPFSQRANIDLGATETGFLLGFIPAEVHNSVTSSKRRQSAALFYLSTNPAPPSPVYAPPRHRDMVRRIVDASRFHGRLADPPARQRLVERSVAHPEVDRSSNLVVTTVARPGADLARAVEAVKERSFERLADALYVDLPLELPETAVAADMLADIGLCFAGLFPNGRARGDVLRLQCVRPGTVATSEVAVASAHGRVLLDYVTADLRAAGHRVVTADRVPSAP